MKIEAELTIEEIQAITRIAKIKWPFCQSKDGKLAMDVVKRIFGGVEKNEQAFVK